MRCPRCDADTPEGAKFCIGCGTPLRSRCRQCGADVLPRAKFCAECGTPLTGKTLVLSAALLPSVLRDIPGHLAEKILGSGNALEGEIVQAKVLFGDLKGSMALVADRNPEGAQQMLNSLIVVAYRSGGALARRHRPAKLWATGS
jgi:hypothetical protein